jgi:O-antigen/teichoic acid export membrane protein
LGISESTIKHFFNFGIGQVIGSIINVLSVSITTRLIIPEEFGKTAIFSLSQTLFLLFLLLGLDQAFVRYYNELKDTRRLIVNAIVPVFILCFLVLCVVLFFQKKISLLLFGQYEPVIIWLFCLFLPSLIVQRFSFLIIQMELQGRLYSLVSVITHIISFIVLLCFLFFYERTFRSIVYAIIFSTIFNAIVSYLLTHDKWSLGYKYFDRKLIIKLFRFGMPLLPATMLSWTLNSIDKIELRHFSSYIELGLYTAAFKIVAVLSVIQGILTTAWIPIAYKWHKNGEGQDKFEKANVAVLSVMFIGFAFMVLFRGFIVLVLGKNYQNTELIYIFLLFVPVMTAVSETTVLGIAFSGKTISNIYISTICAFLNIVGNYLLIPDFGAKGAAIATAITYIVFFWSRTLFSRMVWFKFRLLKYVINIFFVSLLLVIINYNASVIFELMVFLSIAGFNVFLLCKYKIIKRTIK